MNKAKRARKLIELTELQESARTLDQEVASLFVATVDMEKVNACADAMNGAVPDDAKTVEVVYGAVLLAANAMAKADGLSPAFKAKICAGLGDAMGEMVATWAFNEVMREPVDKEAAAEDEASTPRAGKNGAKPPKRAAVTPTPPAPPPHKFGPAPYTERIAAADHDVYLIDEFNGLDAEKLPEGRPHAAIMERQGSFFMDPQPTDGDFPPEATHVVWKQEEA